MSMYIKYFDCDGDMAPEPNDPPFHLRPKLN